LSEAETPDVTRDVTACIRYLTNLEQVFNGARRSRLIIEELLQSARTMQTQRKRTYSEIEATMWILATIFWTTKSLQISHIPLSKDQKVEINPLLNWVTRGCTTMFIGGLDICVEPALTTRRILDELSLGVLGKRLAVVSSEGTCKAPVL
jgi:hypothetical protein